MLQTVFAPGASPFHTKGLAYRGHLEFVAEHVPGGVAAQNAAFGDEALRAFFKQPFVAGGWYDVFPLAEAGLVCARLRGEPLHALLQTRARHQVQRDLRGVYGFLARFASQRLVARGVVDATQRYFDFLSTRTEQITPTHVHATVTGLPEALGDWMTVLMLAYAQATFEHVGGSEVQVRTQRPTLDGSMHGLPTVTAGLEIRW
jgi:hypothetical protein